MSSNTFEKWTSVGIKNGTDAAAAMLAMVLEDMQAAGLIDLSPKKEISLVEPDMDKEFSLAPRLNAEKQSVRVWSHE
jgi:hypothetical protein